MVNEVTLELINLAVDKEASPAQQAELAEILGRSEEARIAFESIQEVVHKLEAAAPIDVPPEIKAEVMESLRSARSSPPAAEPWGGAEVKPFPRRWAMVATWTAAAAIVGAIAFIPQLRSFDTSKIASQASGAMVRPHDAEWQEIARGTSGGIGLAVRRSGEHLAVTASTRSAADILLRWDSSQLQLDQKDRATTPAAPGESASAVLHCSASACPELHFTAPSAVPTELLAMSNSGEKLRLSIPAR